MRIGVSVLQQVHLRGFVDHFRRAARRQGRGPAPELRRDLFLEALPADGPARWCGPGRPIRGRPMHDGLRIEWSYR
jgi:hypothetical protein